MRLALAVGGMPSVSAGGRAQRAQGRGAGQGAEGDAPEMMTRFRNDPGAEMQEGGVLVGHLPWKATAWASRAGLVEHKEGSMNPQAHFGGWLIVCPSSSARWFFRPP